MYFILIIIEFIVYFEKKTVFNDRLKLVQFVFGFAESIRKSTIDIYTIKILM